MSMHSARGRQAALAAGGTATRRRPLPCCLTTAFILTSDPLVHTVGCSLVYEVKAFM
jgi:hypothetical protein